MSEVDFLSIFRGGNTSVAQSQAVWGHLELFSLNFRAVQWHLKNFVLAGKITKMRAFCSKRPSRRILAGELVALLLFYYLMVHLFVFVIGTTQFSDHVAVLLLPMDWNVPDKKSTSCFLRIEILQHVHWYSDLLLNTTRFHTQGQPTSCECRAWWVWSWAWDRLILKIGIHGTNT